MLFFCGYKKNDVRYLKLIIVIFWGFVICFFIRDFDFVVLVFMVLGYEAFGWLGLSGFVLREDWGFIFFFDSYFYSYVFLFLEIGM